MQPKYWSIDSLPGIMQPEQEILKQAQINHTNELLSRTRTIQSKKNLANQLKLNQKYINKWVVLAELACIPSVGHQYCGLLLHAGIASVAQLSQTPFGRLHSQVLRLQVATFQKKDLAPSLEQVKQWVDEAKLLQNQLR